MGYVVEKVTLCKFFSKYFVITLSESFRLCSTLINSFIHSYIVHTTLYQQLTMSLNNTLKIIIIIIIKKGKVIPLHARCGPEGG